jgi:hypothetical protein
MTRLMIALGVVLALGVHAVTLAQTRPDLSGTWRLNVGKSGPNVAGNTPNIPFPSQIAVKQSPTDISVESTSIRQQPISAVYKLDGSKVTVKAPEGISETGEAKFDGGNLVITSRRSFSSPAGDVVVEFKEIWTQSGNVLTIQKTRIQSGDSSTEKAVYDKL